MYLMHSLLFQCLKKSKCLSWAISTSQHGARMGRGLGGSTQPSLLVPGSRGGKQLLGFLASRQGMQAALWFVYPPALQQAPCPQPKPHPCSAKHSGSFVLHCKAWLSLALLPQRREPEEPRHQPSLLSWSGQVRVAAAQGLSCQD